MLSRHQCRSFQAECPKICTRKALSSKDAIVSIIVLQTLTLVCAPALTIISHVSRHQSSTGGRLQYGAFLVALMAFLQDGRGDCTDHCQSCVECERERMPNQDTWAIDDQCPCCPGLLPSHKPLVEKTWAKSTCSGKMESMFPSPVTCAGCLRPLGRAVFDNYIRS